MDLARLRPVALLVPLALGFGPGCSFAPDGGGAGTESTGDSGDASDDADGDGGNGDGGNGDGDGDGGDAPGDGTDAPGDGGDDAPGDGGDAPGDDGSDGAATALPFVEDFEGMDGSPWPPPWQLVGTHVLEASLQGGRGRLTGPTTSTARVGLGGFMEVDIDAAVAVQFDDWTRQGFGFVARHNGGAAMEEPGGQGYAMFDEGGGNAGLGLWREMGGFGDRIAFVPHEPLMPGSVYWFRLQVQQVEMATQLRAKFWLVGTPEPDAWLVEVEDATPELQSYAGSFAVDVYNFQGEGGVFIDDITIDPL